MKMAKYYTITLTEAQYDFVNEAMHEYGLLVINQFEEDGYHSKTVMNVMERTEQAIANCKISSCRKKTTKEE
tara:strand:- start:436 stop:651 length:216 start_codon:yes stop_codon:yes gene_type:complete